MASFEIISDILEIEVIAIGKSIRDLPRLRSHIVMGAGER